MQDINRWIGVGRLTKEPEISATKKEIPVAKFSIASNGFKDKTNFFDIVAWRGLATICGQYLKKGMRVCVDGYLTQETWVSQNGQKINRIKITAESVQIMEKKSENQVQAKVVSANANISIPELDEEPPF